MIQDETYYKRNLIAEQQEVVRKAICELRAMTSIDVGAVAPSVSASLGELWRREMSLDLQCFSSVKKNEVVGYMQDFITHGIQRQDLTADNFLDAVKQLAKITHFGLKTPDKSYAYYDGTRYTDGTLYFNPGAPAQLLQNAIEHELGRCVHTQTLLHTLQKMVSKQPQIAEREA